MSELTLERHYMHLNPLYMDRDPRVTAVSKNKMRKKATTSLSTVAVVSTAIAELDKGNPQKARQILRQVAGSPIRRKKKSPRREKSVDKRKKRSARSPSRVVPTSR